MRERFRGRPYPEALPGDRGGKWTVASPAESNVNLFGTTDIVHKQMNAPSLDGDMGLFVRTHEMLHARYSPLKIGPIAQRRGIPVGLLMQAEDVRMTVLGQQSANVGGRGFAALMQAGVLKGLTRINPSRRDLLVDHFRASAEKSPAAFARDVVAWKAVTVGTADWNEIDTLIRQGLKKTDAKDADRTVLERLLNKLDQHIVTAANEAFHGAFPEASKIRDRVRKLPSFTRSIVFAKALQRLHDKIDEIDPAKRDRPGEKKEVDGKPPDERAKHRFYDSPGTWAKKTLAKRKDTLEELRRKAKCTAGNRWGSMTIETPRLTEMYEVRHKLRKISATDAGEVIGPLDRLLTDGSVFRDVRRRLTGTVLVDISGSMSFSYDQLRSLILTAPGVLVAVYAADETDHGILRVLAHKGTIAQDKDLYYIGSGNIIDGPALKWLGSQRGPRLWVSDGGVTGCGDSSDLGLTLEAAIIQRQHRITRVPKVDNIMDGLVELHRRKIR